MLELMIITNVAVSAIGIALYLALFQTLKRKHTMLYEQSLIHANEKRYLIKLIRTLTTEEETLDD